MHNSYDFAERKQSITIPAIIMLMAVGTGSVYDVEHVKGWEHHIQSRTPYDVDTKTSIEYSTTTANFPDIRTTRQHIDNIRQIFNMPISNMADILNVSRQAVYKWLAGHSTPEQDKQNLIKILSQIADKFQEAGISHSGTLLRMKAFENQSLVDILLSGKNTDRYVAALIDEAKIMELSYQNSGLSESKSQPTSNWQSSISIPGFPEKN